MRTSHGFGIALIASALFLIVPPAAAQLDNVPPPVRRTIAALGPTLNPDMIAKSFAAMRPLQAPRAGLVEVKDVAYGTDPLQKLDIWRRNEARTATPIVLFVHGGGFLRGDKNDYDNVPAYFARHGFLGVNINYRLAPKATFPGATLDLGSAVAWVRANASRYGGDPNRIVVVGHSAGAAIVASYALDQSIDTSREGVVGAVVVSVPAGHADIDNPYYAKNAAKDAPMAHFGEGKMPLLVTMAEYDPLALSPDSHELAA
ncbi:MAG TPA: alpha/beta hydrolase, partial [Stellaceae bacterium]|nr:alpha/beta hydrolase [Stellaceae bacterium]